MIRHTRLSFLPVFLTVALQIQAQNEFDKYGPLGSIVYTDLRSALKSGKDVYKLDLSYQETEIRQLEKLPELTNLQSLRLRANSITMFPSGFQRLSNLVYLASYNNKLESFLPAPESYKNLQYLELQHTSIDSIPASIAYFQKLRSLKFGNTDDTVRLPATFRYLVNLRDVSFENCVMDSLPEALFEIPGLTYLNLSNTNTFFLGSIFEKMRNLEVLVIENNHLSSIPFDIYKAGKLRIISFRGNKLTRLPGSISELRHLNILDVRGNKIDERTIEELKILLPGCEIRF